jgi:peptidoglycan/LPS O-acetylase OafA/YrhL
VESKPKISIGEKIMVSIDFKKDTWIYILIAAVLALISIFTPLGTTDTYMGVSQPGSIFWWSSFLLYNPDQGSWIFEIDGRLATVSTLGITCMSIAILLFYGIHNMKGMDFKWDWLVYALVGIALIIFPILLIVFDSETYATGEATIGFAPIGILISGIMCTVAFIFEKFVGRGE